MEGHGDCDRHARAAAGTRSICAVSPGSLLEKSLQPGTAETNDPMK